MLLMLSYDQDLKCTIFENQAKDKEFKTKKELDICLIYIDNKLFLFDESSLDRYDYKPCHGHS